MIVVLLWLFVLYVVRPTPAVADASSGTHEMEGHRDIAKTTVTTDKNQCTYSDDRVCQFYDIVVNAARRHEVEPPLVMAIIQAESRYDPQAVSHSGAQGLMQLMPGTAKAWGVSDSFNPKQNVEGGVRYFKWLLKLFKGDKKLALAAYNAGLENVYHHDGVPPFPATRIYLKKVWHWYELYKYGERNLQKSQDVSKQPEKDVQKQ